MHALTMEWIDKAEGDFHTASREARVRKAANYDAVCFHAQQCVEKYLKAYLQEHGQPFPRIHDLIDLLELILLHDGTFELQREFLKELSGYAVEFRYPGEIAAKEEARAALMAMKAVRGFVRAKMGLDVGEKL
jgi:HEPN domain-containing protein